MTQFLLANLTLILCLGVFAQWVAWRLRLPSLLMLLVFGFIAGPVFGWLSPDAVFGEMLSPLVAMSIAFILFEEGLGFKFSEFGRVGSAVRNLVSVGAIITWLLAAYGAYTFAHLEFALALLFGALVAITGPSVIVQLLREVPLKGQLGSILRSEGTAIEPVGVTITVLILGGILSSEESGSIFMAVVGVLKTAFVGISMGVLAAVLLIYLFRSALVPDFLRNAFVFLAVVVAFTLSNTLQAGSGLLAATVLGMILANQSMVTVAPVMELNESVRVLGVSMLFVVLAARVDIGLLREFNLSGLMLIVFLVLVARPVSVLIATIGSQLPMKERFFLAAIAPRGFVPAGLSSLVTLELIDIGFPHADRVVLLTFFVIVATVTVYGLATPVVARWLGVVDDSPHGIFLLGAHDWARSLAREFVANGFRVLLLDSNHYHVVEAKREGIPARHGNVFQDEIQDEVVLDGFSTFVGLTSNDEVNTLAALHFGYVMDRDRVLQLAPAGGVTPGSEMFGKFQNRFLFGRDVTFESLEDFFSQGGVIRTVAVEIDSDRQTLRNEFGEGLIPLFVVHKNGELQPFSSEVEPFMPAGSKLICALSSSIDETIGDAKRFSPPAR